MSRTPYSPFVEKETAPLPWKVGRLVVCVRERSSIPSDFVGIVRRAAETRQRRAVAGPPAARVAGRTRRRPHASPAAEYSKYA
jgi:hypothetical protein